MKTRCPACGATASLDALVQNEAAVLAIDAALRFSGNLRRPLVAYLGLFRASTRELSFDRVAKLLNEIQPDIERGKIKRNGIEYPAPIEVWISAIEATVKARDDGRLTLPLKDHGYLYAVISQTKAQPVVQAAAPVQAKAVLRGVAPEDMVNHLAANRRPHETTDETYQRLLKEQNQ